MSDQSDYHSHPRPELVAQIDAAPGNRILDLGCGSGAMSASIRAAGKGDVIWGVEINPGAARLARESGVFERVLEGDLESVLPELPQKHFTHIIAGDVLEHLVDPWTVCQRLRDCMVEDGEFVCSIPNIRNFSFLLALAFKGSFEYRDHGVLDRTHLRFFARPDVHEMFEGAGFSDIRISPVRPKDRLSWKIGRAVFGDLVIKGFLVRARNSTPPAA